MPIQLKYLLFVLINLCIINGVRCQSIVSDWQVSFERGEFTSLLPSLKNSVHHPNLKIQQYACRLLGDIEKVKGDFETALYYWNQSDSIGQEIGIANPALRAIRLGHLSTYFYEKFDVSKTRLYVDSLFKLTEDNRLSDSLQCWLLNVYAQSKKLTLRDYSGVELVKQYRQHIFPTYEKSLRIQENSVGPKFMYAQTLHLYANSFVDLIPTIKSNTTSYNFIDSCQSVANELYDRAIEIYHELSNDQHYQIARSKFVKALAYTYTFQNRTSFNFDFSLSLFEDALASYDLKNVDEIISPTNALSCSKHYQRTLLQYYKINSNLEIKNKIDSAFYDAEKLWQSAFASYRSQNPNQLFALYDLVPFSERIKQKYFEYLHRNSDDVESIFKCLQLLKYHDKKKWSKSAYSEIVSIESVQSELTKNQCYIDFSTNPEPFLLFVSKYDYQIIPLVVSELEVLSLQKAITDLNYQEYVTTAYNLFLKIFQDVNLNSFSEAIISPSNWFHKIPFNALLGSKKGIESKDYRKLDYLMHHVNFKMVFSVNDFITNPTQISNWHVDVIAPEYDKQFILPFAQLFVDSMESFGLHYTQNEHALQKFMESKSAILHFSGHANWDKTERESSSLVFNQDKFSIADVYARDWNCKMAVLNACSTGEGIHNEGDGLDGFQRAFYMKGVAQIMYSIWDLDDRSSHIILNQFYKNLALGSTTSASLRTAQFDYISNALNSSLAAPFYWAGHRAMGADQKFKKRNNHSKSSLSPWILSLLIILIPILYIISNSWSAKP